MKTRYILPFVMALLFPLASMAQDSAKVVKTLRELVSICAKVDFADPKVQELGMFYKAAPYIVYQGEDEKRRWKSAANYKDPGEKEHVDEICARINQTVNQDTSYKVTGYATNKESEGVWHLVYVNYVKNERKRNITFAFLKINGKFLLGDID